MDFAQNYEDVASAWANRVGEPFGKTDQDAVLGVMLMQALWSGIYQETFDSILADPPAFAERVDAYLLALA